MSSNSSHIRPLTLELPALEHRKKCCGYDSACIFDRIIIKLEGNKDRYKILNEFESQHIHLDDIRLDRVKSRRGRPKGTKTPFWNFSKKTSVANKKERRQRKLKIQAKGRKFER